MHFSLYSVHLSQARNLLVLSFLYFALAKMYDAIVVVPIISDNGLFV